VTVGTLCDHDHMSSLDQALAHLDDAVARRLSSSSVPGLTLALTDRDRLLHAATYGYANIAARAPVTPDTLFDIASIGKWFTAVALLQQYEAGRLDLHAPVGDYLPWFAVRSRFAPITAHHLLSHTAGLATAYAETPGSRYDTAALRDTEVSYAPGRHFHYSNTGYKTLGFLLETLTGRPRGATIKATIFDPLILRHGAERIALERRGSDTFYIDHPDWALFLLRLERAGGQVVEAYHGPHWYMHQRYSGPTSFVTPPQWDAYPGHYRSHNPWTSNIRIVLRKGALALIHPDGGEQPLTPLADGAFRLGATDHSPERLRFDTIVDGHALRASLSGELYYRALVS